MWNKIVKLGALVCLLLTSSIAVAAPANATNLAQDETTLSFYGQSAFMLSHGDTHLIFDPWLTGNPWKAATADEIECQYILVSHAHGDHLGDTAAIAKRTGAKVVTTSEIARMLKEQGCDVAPMSIGGKRDFDFGYVKVTLAIHGSGIAGGQAAGFIVHFFDKTIYFAGDTALFGDMALIGKTPIDYALLPIGDNYTMGIDDAVEAVELLHPKTVIPMHYNSNELIKQSPEEFKNKVQEKYKVTAIIMLPGEKINL